MEIDKGKMIECFAVTPNINICWLSANVYYVQFAWLFWYITFATKKIKS